MHLECEDAPAVAGVRLFPRRKAGETRTPPEKGRLPIRMDLDSIRMLFGMRQPEAAKRLAISLTALKQVCRKLGITRWPYHRPCSWKRNSRIQPHTDKQDAIAIDVSIAPMLCTRSEDTDTRACLSDSDSADSDSGASTLHDSSHSELRQAAEGISPCDRESEGMSQLSSSANAASIVTVTDHHTAPLYFTVPEEIPPMVLDTYDDDLGWLVSPGNLNLQSHPVVDDLAFEMVWREQHALEAKQLERERATCFFNLTI